MRENFVIEEGELYPAPEKETSTPQTTLIEKEIAIPAELSPLDALIFLVRIADRAENLSREGLWKVQQDGSWSDRFSSWGEFVESPAGLNKSQSWASKHTNIHEHYTLKGGIAPENLEGIATESLYLAKDLPGTIEEQVAMAKTLSRKELKDTKVDGGHEHTEAIRIWKCCNMRIYDEPETNQA